jgi:CubicO group peptidase (beta-lactamase class C family)
MNFTRRSLLASVPAIYFGSRLPSRAANTTPFILADMEAEARRLIEKHNLPALAAGVLTADGLKQSLAVGVRKAGENKPVTTKDQWHISSNTKAMTATLLATFIEKGQAGWDDTLESVIPEDCRGCAPAVKEITIRQLLQHRSGLPANFNWSLVPPDKRREILRNAAPEGTVIEPGKAFLYSNTGYGVAGRIAEKLGNRQWESLMEQRLFKPLGMKKSGFGPVGARRGDQPWPHGEDGKPRAVNGDNSPSLGPAGTVHCTLEDYALFAADHLKGAAGKPALLKKETYAELHRPSPGSPYACGWAIEDHKWAAGTAYVHDGSNTSNYFTAKLSPARQFGILVCTNEGGESATQGVHALCQVIAEAWAASLSS